MEQQTIADGRRLLRHNIVAAFLTGGVLLWSSLFGWDHWPVGLLIGVLYSNAFEYFYHRFLLHDGTGPVSQNHRLHHDSFGQSDEPLHLSFGSSPAGVVLLVAFNSLPFALLDSIGAGIGGGVVIGFVGYFAIFEEMHWRIHLGRLPKRLEWMRRHHFAHHKGSPGRYNVFLPIFDKLFGSNA